MRLGLGKGWLRKDRTPLRYCFITRLSSAAAPLQRGDEKARVINGFASCEGKGLVHPMIERLISSVSHPRPGPFASVESRDQIRLPDPLPCAIQLPHSYQVVCRCREGELRSDSIDPSMSCLPHRSDGLQPAEDLFHFLPASCGLSTGEWMARFPAGHRVRSERFSSVRSLNRRKERTAHQATKLTKLLSYRAGEHP